MQLAHAIYANGSTASLDAANLAELGIRIDQETASLSVFSENPALVNAIFELTIKTTVEEEPDWANTTHVKIKFNKSEDITQGECKLT